ncbi:MULTISPECIES: hypothetical protein [unclassified Bradyrhizobium]|uniref:hypothetical protein n=1 Tax=unclassified Bradyrhizobium TaxID=2631580 RepID=UPI002305B8BD|nr:MULTISPECIES: hypothetical protein [unclassified Bradyrhizobium]MDA9451280.1 hypothetical protein [Bradyrhizobium sp. CCBAU 21360]MDA9457660.1 hypothetical protein [Bradyrhizobium sp. CCBAU 21359]
MTKKILTPTDIQRICAWIEEQPGKVKFPAIREACPTIIDKEFSIVALRKTAILEAVHSKNRRIELGEITDPEALPSRRDIERNLRARVQVLEAKNGNLVDYIYRLTTNAHRLGYSFDELERETSVSRKATRERHESQALEIEAKTRSRVEKQIEHERGLEAAHAERRKRKKLSKRGKKAVPEVQDEQEV